MIHHFFQTQRVRTSYSHDPFLRHCLEQTHSSTPTAMSQRTMNSTTHTVIPRFLSTSIPLDSFRWVGILSLGGHPLEGCVFFFKFKPRRTAYSRGLTLRSQTQPMGAPWSAPNILVLQGTVWNTNAPIIVLRTTCGQLNAALGPNMFLILMSHSFLDRTTFYGTFPRRCPVTTGNQTAHGHTSIHGKHVSYAGYVLERKSPFFCKAGDL